LEELFKRYSSLSKECTVTDKFEASAGRVWQIRSASKKLIFADVRSGNYKIQVQFNLANINSSKVNDEKFLTFTQSIRRGDIIGFEGMLGRTKAGELTVFASYGQILTPCLHMLPSDYSGLTNKDTRYKKR
jgi:lysyl-tRNA synthetase class 2